MRASEHVVLDEAIALEEIHRRGWSDGLPVVVPTRERVAAMVLAGGLDPDIILGTVAPGDGEATVEKVAVNAVMAGCLPDHFPVVIAAVRAVCDENCGLALMQVTTHAVGPVIIVNGPARESCGGIASGWGALGPGHRANASIGRALRLVLGNLGGARPGVSDMAVLGQPGKFTSCFAEAEELSPFPPLHTTRGFSRESSAVTVLGVDAPHSVIASTEGDDVEAPERILRTLAAAIANAGSNALTNDAAGTTLVVLSPLHAQIVAKRYSREGVQQRLHELAVVSKRVLNGYAPLSAYPPEAEDELVHAIATPDKVVVAVAGGQGIYSAVFDSTGAPGMLPVTREIEIGQSCELPGVVSLGKRPPVRVGRSPK